MDEKTWRASTVIERIAKLWQEIEQAISDHTTIGEIPTAILVNKAYDSYYEKWEE